MPVSVTNKIEAMDSRPSCDNLLNAMLMPEEVDIEAANKVGILFAPGDSTIQTSGDAESNSDDEVSEGLGPLKSDASPEDGLGSAGILSPQGPVTWLCALGLVMFLL